MSAEQRWMRRNAYALKRTYPCMLSLYQNTVVSMNYATGLKNDTKVVAFVTRAALMPSDGRRTAGPASSQMNALYDSRNRAFLLDLRDVTPGFRIDENLEVVHEHKRYKVDTVTAYGSEFVVLNCTWLEGGPANEVINLVGEDAVTISDSYS